MGDERYNGWTNWETWNLSTWIVKDEASYIFWRDKTVELDAQSLADALQQAHSGLLGNMPDGWHKDVLREALSRVNWAEVADSLQE